MALAGTEPPAEAPAEEPAAAPAAAPEAPAAEAPAAPEGPAAAPPEISASGRVRRKSAVGASAAVKAVLSKPAAAAKPKSKAKLDPTRKIQEKMYDVRLGRLLASVEEAEAVEAEAAAAERAIRRKENKERRAKEAAADKAAAAAAAAAPPPEPKYSRSGRQVKMSLKASEVHTSSLREDVEMEEEGEGGGGDEEDEYRNLDELGEEGDEELEALPRRTIRFARSAIKQKRRGGLAEDGGRRGSGDEGSLAVGDVIVEVNGKDAGMEGELGPLLPPAKATVSSGGMVLAKAKSKVEAALALPTLAEEASRKEVEERRRVLSAAVNVGKRARLDAKQIQRRGDRRSFWKILEAGQEASPSRPSTRRSRRGRRGCSVFRPALEKRHTSAVGSRDGEMQRDVGRLEIWLHALPPPPEPTRMEAADAGSGGAPDTNRVGTPPLASGGAKAPPPPAGAASAGQPPSGQPTAGQAPVQAPGQPPSGQTLGQGSGQPTAEQRPAGQAAAPPLAPPDAVPQEAAPRPPPADSASGAPPPADPMQHWRWIQPME
ncbi:hypothetical protein EMIHUDRAFT_463429 [Emiliania huxleyi CCMP1516]|uniref:PDZ domain-containing protein n=2 Tax=Emiliania huxleyi TaxID=2903 RepID=A0A0D3JQP3_EMIH1|nr:hypothetical protein EMIHUDRAFT_463429 [Emiliania huxleyi CCMP1516]EOD25828.1 hypothetical protein EMIHUDRAFT_463429 [Emiliania huxleyi CCMP1516]|eukprot:XP_005778257.1 hypothetical protein EMIHUDRAFT_463429 [Emiliania huxleyi CCMP1516]